MPCVAGMRECLLLGLFIIHIALASTSCPPVSVRFPPTIKANQPSHWMAPPLGWDFGNWYQTNSSSAGTAMRNIQYSTLPDKISHPEGRRTDLSSFQIPDSDKVYTSFGWDVPTRFPAVYNYTGTGILANATDFLQVLAWGIDCHGMPYRVSYSTYTAFSKTPASIDVLSRTSKAPAPETLKAIQNALVAFGDKDIAQLAQSLGAQIQDGGRDGMSPILFCDAECKTNKDLLALLG